MRLDQKLTALGLADSRAKAQALIKAGAVRVDGAPAARAAQNVREGQRVEVLEDPCPWVSRAALKLVHALDLWGLDPAGATALDLGASTGGFTEVLLARGAARVIAVDVGHGQLHPRLAADPRVDSREGTNARDLAEDLLRQVDWITADLSFISLTLALPPALAAAAPGARLIALIKPQFEAGREAIGKGGHVKDPEVLAACRAKIADFLRGAGWRVTGEAESPIRGGDGAQEFLITAQKR